ncbi:hypothetical protein PISMIDRAFT_683369 [Pisolithus microcarpus 441]|uniref:Uncharacterized protein n=1 Tax=Pisolithus microcarpus 441 TaxID=765257 RepID=A0A0C9ZH18_9AGAM|nr:hypothetical protein PISMIDRAFT_683369 [Pisolithus microcarpus 441]
MVLSLFNSLVTLPVVLPPRVRNTSGILIGFAQSTHVFRTHRSFRTVCQFPYQA